MNKDLEFLNYISQNAKMGMETLTVIIKHIEGDEFKGILEKQLDEYKEIYNRCEELFDRVNKESKDRGTLEKIATYMTTKIEIKKDDSDSHIAEVIIKSKTVGITDLTKAINKYSDASSSVMALAKKLIKIEESDIDKLKPYLR